MDVRRTCLTGDFSGAVSIKPELIDRLLDSGEGVTLDFKRAQYLFEGRESKSELLKDVLAFANTPRQDDAYILIGVEEKRGTRSEVVGVEKHLDDANLQQFVNSKTQRPVRFSYREATHDGRSIGVLLIPMQMGPLYATADYGKVKKHAVYVRHGSSTAIANPDEIRHMGAPTMPAATPTDPRSGTPELDGYQAFLKAPDSGKLAGKVIVRSKDTEEAERVVEIFRSAPDKRDEVYVDVAWAEHLMAKGDERHEDAMGHIGFQTVRGVYSDEDRREAQRYLPPDLGAQPAQRSGSPAATEVARRLNTFREDLAGHIGRVMRGAVTTTSIGPGGHLRGECVWARQCFAEHDIPCPEVDDFGLTRWHDLLCEVVPMLERGSSMHEVRERAVTCLARPP